MTTAPELRDAGASTQAPVALAASAGGVEAVGSILHALPADFPAPVIVLEHVMARHPSLLASVFGRTTALEVKEAEQGEPLRAGTAFVAPPDRHTTVRNGCIWLDEGPRVSYVRPSASVLFESLADEFGARALVVILTGTGADGAAGALVVKGAGGRVIVQEPASAAFAGMPSAAVDLGAVSEVMPLAQIPAAILAHVAALPTA